MTTDAVVPTYVVVEAARLLCAGEIGRPVVSRLLEAALAEIRGAGEP